MKIKKIAMKNQTVKNFIWNTLGASINSFISLFYLIIVTRINGIDVSGIFSYCYSFSLIMYVVSNLGGRTYQLTDNEKYDDNYHFSVRFYTSLISFLFSFLYCLILGYNLIKTIILLTFILIRIIETFSDTIYCIFQKKNHLDYAGISMFIKNIACLTVFALVDRLTGNIVLSTVSILIATCFVYCFYDIKQLKKFKELKLIFDNKVLFKLLYEIRYFFLVNFVTIFYGNAPKIIVDILYTDELQGYFGIIMMIPTVMGLFGSLTIQPMLLELTKLCREKKSKELLKKLFNVSSITLAFAVFCSLCAYFMGVPVLGILYEIDFTDYKIFLVLAVVTGLINVYTGFASTILTIIKKTRIQFYLYLVIAIITILDLLLFSNIFGFNGMFIACCVTSVISCIIFCICFLHYVSGNFKNV